MDLSKPNSTFLNLFKPIQTYPNLSQPIHIWPNLSKPIKTLPNLFKPIQTYPNILEPTWNQLQQFSKTLVKYYYLKNGENITATIQLEWVCEKHFLKEVVWDDIFYFYPDIWCSDCAKIAELKLFWKKLGERAQIKPKEQNVYF